MWVSMKQHILKRNSRRPCARASCRRDTMHFTGLKTISTAFLPYPLLFVSCLYSKGGMFSLGAVQWLETTTNSTSNSSFPDPMSTCDEWLHVNMIISLTAIPLVLVYTQMCSLPKMGLSTVLTLVSLVIALLLSPIVGAVLLICSLYRLLVSFYLKLTVGQPYQGLLHGTDAVWAIEEDTSLSVINVLALADFSFIVSASTQDDEPLQTMVQLIQERIMATDSPFSKLLCFRQFTKLGYFYWKKQYKMDITDYVRWMDIEDQGDRTITESCLKNFVSAEANKLLPHGHSAGWEILVGRYPIKPSSDLLDAMENGGWITKSCVGIRYPVLFRIHHSIGDGVALVKLLIDSLADPSSRGNTPIPGLRSSSPSFNRNFLPRPTTPIIEEVLDEPITAVWQESDVRNCKKSISCDLNCISLNELSDNPALMKKSKTYDFGKCENYNDEVQFSVKAACKNILTLINNAADCKTDIEERKIKDFEIIVNDRPSGEFLVLMKNATNYENTCQSYTHQNINNFFKKLLNKISTVVVMLFSFIRKTLLTLNCFVQQCSILIFAPASLLNQALIQKQDKNLLHGPKLSGHKVVAWYIEQQDNKDQLLMAMIKRIRAKTGVRFSDVLLTALSASLEEFFNQCNEVPQHITVVIPSFAGSASSVVTAAGLFNDSSLKNIVNKVDLKLDNKFSVAMLTLPIANESKSKLKLFTKLRQVRRHCEILRNSPDFLVNYWLLRVVATLLPTPLLRPLVASTHSTLVFSNLPGPARLTQLAGHTLHDLIFWVPNKTSTGLGVTVLSYASRLQLGLMADRAIVACPQDAQQILDGIASSIHLMDQVSTL